MPRVRDYQSQVSPETSLPGREARATDFGGTGLAELGKAVTSAGTDFGQVQRMVMQNRARQEVTDADIAISMANADLTIKLNDMAKKWKPGDGDIAASFDSVVRSHLDGISTREDGSSRFETSAGQERFNERAAVIASNFAVESAKVQSHLDGVQAVQAHNELIDSESNMLQLHPAFFGSVRDDMVATVNNPDGVYGKIPELERQKLIRAGEERLAIAAVQGQIRQTPTVALDRLNRGWMNTYIPAEKMPELINQAKTAVHALEIDADRAHRHAEWERVERARTIENALFTKLAAHDADPHKNPMLTAQDVLDSQLGDVDPVKMGSILSVLHQRSRERDQPVTTDPGVMRDLFERIHLPANDPKKIKDETILNEAYSKRGKLTFEDLGRLRKEFQDARSPEGERLGQEKAEFLRGMQSSITKSNPMLGKLDPEGDSNMYRFSYMVDRKIEEFRKAGKDPHDLFDPEKPEFLGRPERLKPYQKSLMSSIKDISKRMQENAKQASDELPEEQKRKPGESYSDWKKRVIK